MAQPARPGAAGLASLPGEILLHILSYLEPPQITSLQLVSRAFRNLARDDSFWRSRCLQESSYLETLNRYRALRSPSEQQPQPSPPLAATDFAVRQSAARALQKQQQSSGANNSDGWKPTFLRSRERERARIMANWDPSFPGEHISWYDEYIQRHGPIAINWLAVPRHHQHEKEEQNITGFGDFIEARGVALYRPDNPREEDVGGGLETLLAVSPLDDGSVCLWDINGTRAGRRGAIVAKSRPGILFIDGPGADNSRRSKRVDSGVTECVSVDSRQHRAFFAVQSHLIEVDLQRLSVVDCESFPWSITALSSASPRVPLTVGTNQGIHLHDYRSRKAFPFRNDHSIDRIDEFDRMGAEDFYKRSLERLFDDEPLPPYAPLAQPGPLSILHLQQPGLEADLSDDIYVAGRFSSILHYDRRKFPAIRGSIHSGARLCSMTSLPYPFSTVDSELRRQGQLSLEQVERSKNTSGGRCLIAAGEYNTKGSLELYGLLSPSLADSRRAGGLQNAVFQNRQTCSDSKLLSVVNHGSRVAFSDGSGYIKWFERDGFTEVRRCRIGHSETAQGPSVFASMPGSDDIARKLLPTRAGAAVGGNDGKVNDNDLLFWTGEKLGLATFSARPGFRSEEFEGQINAHGEEALERAREEKAYSDKMRRALERQADDVRFVRNLGIGSGRRQHS
ncbi:hypothetical protein B0H66DRAFT_7276 [Apodospora peruviana]|uniref:F-box domain-containing protein n=1 Tax=Apodospora peruviana TaxID=516989 RepID=A0AAE0MDV5_9PEZI|nr:hypothetical protein B0H66DRAFT_7276 [Apodospora peruviana]